MKSATTYQIDVNPKIPPRLERMEEIAGNLWYSWDHHSRQLYANLDPGLWKAVGHSPKAFLRRVDERKLIAASEDAVFLNNFNRVLSAYDTYHSEATHKNFIDSLQDTDLVAYFCAEFGFHESMPIYSGGLGILAGDHCKAASDMRLPFVAVGLLYRQGYFSQTIDEEGAQHAVYTDSAFDELPVSAVLNPDGTEAHVQVGLPGRVVEVKIWRARAGHIQLYLLDTDVPSNSEQDRRITHQLYGGDRTTRIEQEIILGFGGVRALEALGIKPTVWHINEGHAAFIILDRIRGLVNSGIDFNAALEAVGAATVFTTHTAVPAGHDHFSDDMTRTYFDAYCREIGISHEALMALGRASGSRDFNMTALAIHGSRHHNGVSRIHRGVSAGLLREFWPQVEPEENPMDYVTNGVHVPTFLSNDWAHAFERYLEAEWTEHLRDRSWWNHVEHLPDHIFWSVHQYLKTRMLHLVRYRVSERHRRNQGSEARLDRRFRLANPDDPNVLTIGFGRRFATYKRAALLFEDLDRLRQILSDPQRPVLFVFAGKAHPADGPGQDLIRRVVQISRMPEFEGNILFVEGYDLRLARRLVSGVDVWLNNPLYPLEASGTSGMKAGMNGVINLSVLDGWWGEGYEPGNGWAIKPARESQNEAHRNREEAGAIYEILQNHVIPLYYARSNLGYSPQWIEMAKRSMATILPRFNAVRMVGEYLSKFYVPAAANGRRLANDRFEGATALAAWKQRIRAAWPSVSIHRIDQPSRRIQYGEKMLVEVVARLDGLAPSDVVVELMFDHSEGGRERRESQSRYLLQSDGTRTESGDVRFVLEMQPELCGRLAYRIRCYPYHNLLTHRFEMGLTVWA